MGLEPRSERSDLYTAYTSGLCSVAGLLQRSAPLPEALQGPEEGQGKTRGAAGRGGRARAEVGVSGGVARQGKRRGGGAELGRGGAEWNLVGIRGGAGRGGNRACPAAAARCGSSQLARAGAAAVAAVTDGDGGGGGGSAGPGCGATCGL